MINNLFQRIIIGHRKNSALSNLSIYKFNFRDASIYRIKFARGISAKCKYDFSRCIEKLEHSFPT